MATQPSAVSAVSAAENSEDPRDKTMVIRQVTPEIITFSVPFVRSPPSLPPDCPLSSLFVPL